MGHSRQRFDADKLTGKQASDGLLAAMREKAKRSVAGAMEWRDPKMVPLDWQRELCAVCDDLIDSALEGTGKKVTLSAPPRHGKSEATGRAMPLSAYLRAGSRPISIMYVTSTATRAKEVSRRVRAAVLRIHRELVAVEKMYANQGVPYTGVPSRMFAPSEDNWTTMDWETEGGHQWKGIGWSEATGGIGANILIMDDMVGSGATYRSRAKREAIRAAVDEDLLSRLMDGGSAIQMETRRGADDTTAWLQREHGDVWEDHTWPCYDESREGSPYLWPEVYGEDWRAKMPHLSDSAPVWRALYQQEPVAEGGTLVATEWLEATYSEPPEVVAMLADKLVFGCDLTSKGSKLNDPAAITVTAYRGEYRDVLQVWSKRCPYPEQRKTLKELHDRWKHHAKGKPIEVRVEAQAGGYAMVEELRPDVAGIIACPAVGDKVSRLTPHLPRIAARQVRTPAQGAHWVQGWKEEVTGFSGIDGEMDNQVDSLTLSLSSEQRAAPPDRAKARKSIQSVFGH